MKNPQNIYVIGDFASQINKIMGKNEGRQLNWVDRKIKGYILYLEVALSMIIYFGSFSIAF